VPSAAFALVGGDLVGFDTSNPATAASPLAVSGIAVGEQLVAIDIRPQNGILYGLTSNNSGAVRLYAISGRTGVATPLTSTPVQFDDGLNPVPITGASFDIDFNPALDRLRVVTDGGFNFRINPNTGTIIDGDAVASGTNPDGAINGGPTTVDGTAYTNNTQNAASTTQYTLDATTKMLYIQATPDSGTQVAGRPVTVDGAPLNFVEVTGFDIPIGVNASPSNSAAVGIGYAFLTSGGTVGFYSIDLSTGAAVKIGFLPPSASPEISLAIRSDAGGSPFVALSADSTELIRGLTTSPSNSATVAISGVAIGETLIGIDFRPATGQLMGLGVNATADTGTLYILDPQTGTATPVGVSGSIALRDTANAVVDLPPTTAGYGIDFNPTSDFLRITTGTGLNFRINPSTGTAFDSDPVSPGNQPDTAINGLPVGSTGIAATAYTNSYGGALATTQYTLDAGSNQLYIQNLPNSGTQTLPKAITLNGAVLDFDAIGGFDIEPNVSVDASNGPVVSGSGIAALTVAGISQLYRIDLATGNATLLGGVGTSPLGGFAVGDNPSGSVGFSLGAYSVLETGGTLVITLQRTGGLTGSATVEVDATGGTATSANYSGLPASVTFLDGQATATIALTILNDALTSTDRTILLSLTRVDIGGTVGPTSSAVVTIRDTTSALRLVSSGPGSVPVVRQFDANGALKREIVAYDPSFRGGFVSVEADLDGDGAPEIITGAGPGGGPHIRVFDGVTGAVKAEFFAFAPTFQGGVSLAVGDINLDGIDDIIVGAGAGGGPHVRVFDGRTFLEIRSFFAYAANFLGGVNVASGDATGDGADDIITSPMSRGGAHVKVFDGRTLAEFLSFFAAGSDFFGGLSVSVADIDGVPRLFVAANAKAPPTVRGFDLSGRLINQFDAYDPAFMGGVRLATTTDNKLITGAGPGGGPHVRIFNPATGALLSEFFAFDATQTTGITVA